jgi:Protein kinase domain
MSALSSTSYVLPPRRPWDPLRFKYWEAERQASGVSGGGEYSATCQIDNCETDQDVGEDGKNSEGDTRACVCPSCSMMSNPPLSSGSSKHSRTSTATTTSNRDGSAASSVSSFSTIDGCPEASGDTPNPSLTAPTVQNVSSARHPHIEPHQGNWVWREGAIHHGHPSIIPLLDFFEDAHYYYLILPAAKPSFPPAPFPLPLQSHSSSPYGYIPPSSHLPSPPLPPHSPSGNQKFPSDLFDLVERYPMGLPASLIRSYLGQIADALAFLHARGICHRDIKDENVVLAEDGRCWLIDFGSSGIVKKEGWDTFSGT